MKDKVKHHRTMLPVVIVLLSFILTTLLSTSAFAIKTRVIRTGDPFPEITLPSPEAINDSNYLGVEAGQSFTPSQIKAEVLLIEFFNVHCPHCVEQAPSYNKLFKYIQKKRQNRDKIKIISIAVGNLASEVDTFKSTHNIPFPIFTDTDFTIWRAIGGKVSPFSVFVRQRDSTTSGHPAGIVCATHSGTNHRYRKIYSQLVNIMEMTEGEVAEFIQEKVAEHPPEPEPDSDEALQDQTYHAFRQLGRVTSFAPITLDSFDYVYKARVFKDKHSTLLYAKVVNRPPVCDVCHNVKIIYIFNGSGEIIDIAPLSISKKGNVAWNVDDVEKLKQRLIGRNLKQPQPFNPDIDAITSATISSSVIYDSISRGARLMEMLELNNHLK